MVFELKAEEGEEATWRLSRRALLVEKKHMQMPEAGAWLVLQECQEGQDGWRRVR